jgi:hypothetical protein
VTEPKPGSGRVFIVKLRPLPHVVNPVKALRSALKVLLRRFGLRCVEVAEITANTQREEVSRE